MLQYIVSPHLIVKTIKVEESLRVDGHSNLNGGLDVKGDVTTLNGGLVVTNRNWEI